MADAASVTTWVGVAASAMSGGLAVISGYLRAKTKERLAAIDHGTPDGARIVADAVTSFNLNTVALTNEQTFLLAREEIAARDKKHARRFLILIGLAVVTAATTVALAREKPDFDVTLRLQHLDGTPAASGIVTIVYDGPLRSEPINENGEANLKALPHKDRSKEAVVRLKSPSYELIAPEETILLDDSPVIMLVRDKSEVIKGREDRAAIEVVRTALEGYRRKANAYPDTLRELPTEFELKKAMDRVGDQLVYRTDGQSGYKLQFAGADGAIGTPDDREHTRFK